MDLQFKGSLPEPTRPLMESSKIIQGLNMSALSQVSLEAVEPLSQMAIEASEPKEKMNVLQSFVDQYGAAAGLSQSQKDALLKDLKAELYTILGVISSPTEYSDTLTDLGAWNILSDGTDREEIRKKYIDRAINSSFKQAFEGTRQQLLKDGKNLTIDNFIDGVNKYYYNTDDETKFESVKTTFKNYSDYDWEASGIRDANRFRDKLKEFITDQVVDRGAFVPSRDLSAWKGNVGYVQEKIIFLEGDQIDREKVLARLVVISEGFMASDQYDGYLQ